MARIRILIGAHLSTAPRPFKEARALAEAGHDVTMQGVWYDDVLAGRDESLLRKAPFTFVPVVDLRRSGLLPRLRRRLGMETWRRFKRFSPSSLGYGVRQHLAQARAAKADLTIAHSEGTLWVAAQLANEGCRVGVDFEDWFSEDLPEGERLRRPVVRLRDLERHLLRHARYRLAPSHAMARALGEMAGTEPPVCVYNVFPIADRHAPAPPVTDRKSLAVPSLHWFSQTIGPGRGLETLLAALPHLNYRAEVHLRGETTRASRRWLDELIPPAWRDRVFVHGTVHNSELLLRIASHDIGLALETPAIRSRDLTVTNKLFQYLLADLAVIATATTGQREVAERANGAVKLVPPDDPPALAAAIDAWLAFPTHLTVARHAAREAVRTEFCWERQREHLLDEAALALAP